MLVHLLSGFRVPEVFPSMGTVGLSSLLRNARQGMLPAAGSWVWLGRVLSSPLTPDGVLFGPPDARLSPKRAVLAASGLP